MESMQETSKEGSILLISTVCCLVHSTKHFRNGSQPKDNYTLDRKGWRHRSRSVRVIFVDSFSRCLGKHYSNGIYSISFHTCICLTMHLNCLGSLWAMTWQACTEEIAPSERDCSLSPEVFVENLHSDTLQLTSDMLVYMLYLCERKELSLQGFFFLQPPTTWLAFFTEDFCDLEGTRDDIYHRYSRNTFYTSQHELYLGFWSVRQCDDSSTYKDFIKDLAMN